MFLLKVRFVPYLTFVNKQEYLSHCIIHVVFRTPFHAFLICCFNLSACFFDTKILFLLFQSCRELLLPTRLHYRISMFNPSSYAYLHSKYMSRHKLKH